MLDIAGADRYIVKWISYNWARWKAWCWQVGLPEELMVESAGSERFHRREGREVARAVDL